MTSNRAVTSWLVTGLASLMFLTLALTVFEADVAASDVEPFQRIYLTGPLEVDIRQSQGEYRVALKSDTHVGGARRLPVFEYGDDALYVIGTGAERVRLTIHTPHLSELITGDGVLVELSEFATDELVMQAEGDSRVTIDNVHARDLIIEGNDRSRVQFSGRTDTLDISLHGLARFTGTELFSVVTHVSARDLSRAEVWVTQILDVMVGELAWVGFRGQPRVAQRALSNAAARSYAMATPQHSFAL